MKILVFNGSPRGDGSNTMCLTQAFLEGFSEGSPAENGSATDASPSSSSMRHLAESSVEIDILPVARMNLQPCRGCFVCWKQTPGECCIRDDMAEVIGKIRSADLVVWSFPLYYFSLPSILKTLMDRQLPMSLPFMTKDEAGEGSGGHPSRFDLSGQRHLVVSTCGFHTAAGNYEAVDLQFSRLLGRNGYERIYCGQGELFRVPELKRRTAAYLRLVKEAGREFAHGAISPDTRSRLSVPLFPRETFEQMADASWGAAQESIAVPEPGADSGGKAGGKSGESEGAGAGEHAGESSRNDPAVFFTRQMAALYKPSSWNRTDKVLEMRYTDRNLSVQIVMGQSGHEVITENLRPFTTRIETPFEVWRKIARGELDGQAAMMAHQYRVEGDFELMIHWDEYFGDDTSNTESSGAADKANPPAGTKPVAGNWAVAGANQAERTTQAASANRPTSGTNPHASDRRTSMTLLLLPWFPLWIGLSIDPTIAGVAGLLVCALIPFAGLRLRTVVYEPISLLLVSVLSLLAIFSWPPVLLAPVSYLLFGLMWTASVFLRVPLTAWYSMNGCGGEKAFKNGLFLRTNRILTACWGILYLLTPIWTWMLMISPLAWLTGAINSVLPIGMGLFTAWFQKWYPAYFAGKR